jgi:predicted nucleotidyltransferase
MPHQQAVLAAIVRYYADDARIRAVLLFGSLAADTGDEYSDLDLDIVLADDVSIDVAEELAGLAAALEPGALIIAHGDEGDVVLPSLIEFSIRYHALADTNPNILTSAQIVLGVLDMAMLETAGLGNLQGRSTESASTKINAFLRYALETDIALRRGRLWMALDLLSRVRLLGMELFALDRGANRPVHAFDALADSRLQSQFAALLPALDAVSIRTALIAALAILPTLPGVMLTADQQIMHARIRQRIAEYPDFPLR